MSLFFTKDQDWLDKWDAYLMQNSKGHYNQLSEWLKSYAAYGFSFELVLLTEDDKIVGGCGIIIAKVAFFKFVIIPAGPILDEDQEEKTETILTKIRDFSKEIKACYLQINMPFLENQKSDYTISQLNPDSFYYTGLEGSKFKYVISVNGFRFVDLSDKNPERNYSSNTKRNISKSSNSTLVIATANTNAEIEIAYKCIENNAKVQGYGIRSFNSFKNTLYALIEKKQALFAVCKYKDEVVGSLFLIECGNRFTYISGGTDRKYTDLKIGHFLHQKMIELSIERGYKNYDISVGGSAGVLRFKEGFGSKHLKFTGTRYWVLQPALFKIYLFFEGYLRPHKAKIALFLSKLKTHK